MRCPFFESPQGPGALLAALLLCACRSTGAYENFELEGASLLGLRHQPGWENSNVPLLRLDGSLRPWSWPVGVKASATISGFAGDQAGAQSGDLGLGIARSFEIEPGRVSGSLGLGHLFVTTDSGDLFANEHDSWGANYVEGGLYFTLDAASGLALGIEARYSSGDGPQLGATRLDGDFLDLFLVLRFGSSAPPPAAAAP